MTSAALNRYLRRLALCAAGVLLVACATPPAVETLDGQPADPPPADPATVAESTDSGRARAIAGYRDYLARYPDSPERDRVIRRLADLLVEQGGDQQVCAEAIGYYEYLLDREPQGPERTELLYQLSRASEESGRSRQALAAIDRLLARPEDADPRLYADTRFRQGELLFSEGDFAGAERAYRAVVDVGASVPAYQAALYKLGWALFKQERYRDALSPLLTLLDLKLAPGGELAAESTALAGADREQMADLYRVISASFAQLDGVDSVDRYFQRVGGRSYEQQVYLQLARWYVEQQQVSEAAGTWLVLAQRDPLAAQAPRLTARAIELYRQADFQQRMAATQERFVADYGMGSEFWTRHSPGDFPAVLQQLQSSLLELAQRYHERARGERARGTADEAAARAAQHWYRQYLEYFGDTAGAAQANMQLAELLYESGHYRQALDEYERTAWSRGVHALAAEAALGALRAGDHAMPEAGVEQRAGLTERAIANALRFVEEFPYNPAAPDLLVRAATALLELQQYAKAMQAGKAAVSAAAGSPALRQVGWSVQAQALFATENYAAAAAAYREALELTRSDDARRSALLEGLAVAIYQQAGRALATGDGQAALALYRQAAAVAPDDLVRSKAQYDAATALLARESWNEAIAALQQFRGDYPDHDLQPEVARRLAYAHERNGDASVAAQAYLNLGQDQRQTEVVQREALLRAADLYVQAGAPERAVLAAETYLERFPEPAGNAVEVMRNLADLASDMGDAGRRRYWLEAIVSLDHSGDDAGTRGTAAAAALELAEYRLGAFRRVQLVHPVQKNLARKIEAMKRALRAFEAAIDYGVDPVTTAATYHIATMYDELGSALLSSERPVDLTAEELAEYNLLLAQQAAPFEQQAIDLYSSNARRQDGGRRDPWIEKSAQQLTQRQAAP